MQFSVYSSFSDWGLRLLASGPESLLMSDTFAYSLEGFLLIKAETLQMLRLLESRIGILASPMLDCGLKSAKEI